MSAPLTRPAPAKLNLYLHITGRRPDGYHTLDSLVAFASLADTVILDASPGDASPGNVSPGNVSPGQADAISLELSGPFAGGLTLGEDNLVIRAARALGATVGQGKAGPVHISLEKNIPLAAGLGGGSADAAATLAGLASLWGADDLALAAIAAGLGADVPVCMEARPTFMAGIGEVLGPKVDMPDMGVVLVNPGLALATKAVFGAFDELGDELADERGAVEYVARPRPVLDPVPAGARTLALALAGTANDLTDAALSLAPVIGDVLGEIAALEGCRLARMAGSGPTCFGLFDDRAAARAAAQRLESLGLDRGRDWWCWAGGFRHPGTPA